MADGGSEGSVSGRARGRRLSRRRSGKKASPTTTPRRGSRRRLTGGGVLRMPRAGRIRSPGSAARAVRRRRARPSRRPRDARARRRRRGSWCRTSPAPAPPLGRAATVSEMVPCPASRSTRSSPPAGVPPRGGGHRAGHELRVRQPVEGQVHARTQSGHHALQHGLAEILAAHADARCGRGAPHSPPPGRPRRRAAPRWPPRRCSRTTPRRRSPSSAASRARGRRPGRGGAARSPARDRARSPPAPRARPKRAPRTRRRRRDRRGAPRWCRPR